MDNGWVTNNPEAAKRLRAADRRYEQARATARNLPLAAKVKAYAAAKAARAQEYKEVLERGEIIAQELVSNLNRNTRAKTTV